MRQKTIIIVHPFTSEKFLYKTVHERGYKIITLITQFDHNWIKLCMDTVNEYSNFILNVTNDIATDLVTIKKLIDDNRLELKGVINAFDYSLEYSDTLTNELLNTNIDLKYSRIRCNKYDVNEELAKNSTISLIKSTLVENRQNWQSSLGNQLKDFKYPVIIKPASDSAAKGNMAIANEINDVERHLTNLFTQNSIFSNKLHTNFIIQEYIVGEEFMVNSVAINKKHIIANIFKYQKKENKLLGSISLNNDKDNIKDIQSLIDYHKKCMDYMQFNYGIVHNEYIIDKSGQPYLIEINNRLSGLEGPYVAKECYHCDEVNIFLDLLENKNNIIEFAPEKIYSHGARSFLSNYFNPKATQLNLAGLSSKYDLIVFRSGVVTIADENNGQLYDKASAVVLLLNDDYTILNKDLEQLRQLEADGKLFI